MEQNPVDQFQQWFEAAKESEPTLSDAMALATVDKSGAPSVRTVLLKDFSKKGMTFFTNYESRKASQLENNSKASLCFHWKSLQRQVLVEGTVEKTSREESEAYFATRPRGSQLGAWVSNQSQVIAAREVLDQRFKEYQAKYEGKEVPCPSHWGGYLLKPHRFEFWQGQSDRLHDRHCYTLESEQWQIQILAP